MSAGHVTIAPGNAFPCVESRGASVATGTNSIQGVAALDVLSQGASARLSTLLLPRVPGFYGAGASIDILTTIAQSLHSSAKRVPAKAALVLIVHGCAIAGIAGRSTRRVRKL